MTIDKGIFIRNIYYMLTYAFQELKQNNYEEIAGEEFEEIHDLFAEILLRGISFQLKQGLHKEYISCHGSLSTLKGKLDICGTVNNLMRKQQKIDCEYDELSENNKFNQILKTTVQFLLKHPKVKSDRKAALKRLMLFFSDVEAVDILLVVEPENCKEFVIQNSEHGGADVVLEVAGSKDTFRLAWECARPNAVVTIVALYDEPQILPLPDMYGKNLIFKTGGVDGCDCAEILNLIEEGKIDTTPLITHRFPLNEIEEAYRIFENKLDGVIKVAIYQ